MDANRYADDLDELKRSLKRTQFIALFISLALILALWNALNMFGRDRTVVTPPNLEKSFWITSSTASASYIEQMALWSAGLILDVTADNVEFKSRLLLEYAHPQAHGTLKERQALEARRLKRDNAATYFVMQTIRSVPEQLAAVITGRLNTLINGTPVTQVEKHYLVRFAIDGGRAHLIEFSEAPNADLNVLLKDRR